LLKLSILETPPFFICTLCSRCYVDLLYLSHAYC
jgi:hypothetical protein